MIKIGLLGAGFMGNMHIECYLALAGEDVRVAAVAGAVVSKPTARKTTSLSG
jgi:predicted dehydrogenase